MRTGDSGDQSEGRAPLYDLLVTDVAAEEAEQAYLWLSQAVSLEYAKRWYSGLLAEIAKLPETARHWPLARENDRYDVEVRRLLYRSGRSAYRILYQIFEPLESSEPGVVRVLHVYHGSKNSEY
jgi:plasmid stabilization system protein ParE